MKAWRWSRVLSSCQESPHRFFTRFKVVIKREYLIIHHRDGNNPNGQRLSLGGKSIWQVIWSFILAHVLTDNAEGRHLWYTLQPTYWLREIKMFCFHFRAAVRLSVFTCNQWGIFHLFGLRVLHNVSAVSWIWSVGPTPLMYLNWWGHKVWDPGLEMSDPISHTRLGPLWTLWHLRSIFVVFGTPLSFFCALFHLHSVCLVNQQLLVILELRAPPGSYLCCSQPLCWFHWEFGDF